MILKHRAGDGRLLNILNLFKEELLNLRSLYLRHDLIAHKADYYRLRLSVTRGEGWAPWLISMLQAVAGTSKWTTGKIAAVRALAAYTTEHMRTLLPKIHNRELVDVIFDQPYCRIGNLEDKGVAQHQAARATCTNWLPWPCCAKCRLATKNFSFTPS